MRLNLAAKVYLIIAIPLALEIVFFVLLGGALIKADQEARAESQANTILLAVNTELKDVLEAAGSLGLYSMNKDEQYKTRFYQALKNLGTQRLVLEKLVDSVGNQELKNFAASSQDIIKSLESAQTLAESRDRFDALRALTHLQQLLHRVSESGMNIMSDQLTITEKERIDRSQLRKQMLILIATGILGSSILAAFVAFYLDVDTAKRLASLMENNTLLASGMKLKPVLPGNDEVATLDANFHAMADALAESQRKQGAMFDNALDVICSLDKNGRFERINAAAKQQWGYEPDQLLGQNLNTLIGDDQKRVDFESMRKPHSDSPLELEIRHKDGALSSCLWRINWSDIDTAFFCVVHDVTEQKRMERLRHELIGMVSHDLRTPLQSVGGCLDLLKVGALGSELNEQGLTSVNSAQKSLARLLGIINDLLDIERLETTQFILNSSVQYAEEILNECLDLLRPEAKIKKITIDNLCLFTRPIQCDKDRILRVLVNLIHNAIKFSPQGGTITVCAREVDDGVEMSVSDQGRGVPKDKREIIFERFRQVIPSDQTEHDGTGLGLAICKAIVTAHGGSIGVKPGTSGGSKFWFVLPCERYSGTSTSL